MKCRVRVQPCSLAATVRQALALFGVLLCSVLGMTGALAQSPTGKSPAVPTSYSWPGYHAGGSLPAASTISTAIANEAYIPPNPFANRQQGTPTGLIPPPPGTSYVTEIPSFLLGNYLPTDSLSVDTTTGAATFANHFLDDENLPSSILSWSAPLTYLTPLTNTAGQLLADSITADNNDTTTQTYPTSTSIASGWQVKTIFTGPWQQNITSSTAVVDPFNTSVRTYARVLAPADPVTTPSDNIAPSTAQVQYQFVAPSTGGGSYSIVFQLPDVISNEVRLADAHYVISINHASTNTTLYDDRISQSDFNDPQFIAGPFAVAAGDTVTVTLDNSNNITQQSIPAPNSNVYVLADTVALVPGASSGTGAAMNGSPTAISVNDFPEIADALYFGFSVTRDATTGLATGQTSDITNPYGNPTIGTTNPDATHRIRQLVYFGRSENIILTDSSGNLVDADGKTTTTPVNQNVGAIYCVDGENGEVVWRFQTPNVLNASPSGFIATGLAGTVHSASTAGPQPFQIGPSAYNTSGGTTLVAGSNDPAARNYAYGTFGTYTAFSPPPFPQIDGNDLDKYGFSLYATTVIPNPSGNNASEVEYKGEFRISAPGYGFTIDDDQYLAKGTFDITATFLDAYNASLKGTFISANETRQPPGFPPPGVNFSSANPAIFTGQFHSDALGNQSITNGILRSISSLAGSTSESGPVFSTPAIARMNVRTSNPGSTATYATKLCVVVADDNGLVYCLDAIGNRNGTSNRGANDDNTGLTSPVNATYNQPIYNPFPGVNTGSGQDLSPTAHVGNTRAYWVYRPDPNKSNIPLPSANANPAATQLPVPEAFGLASPTIYIDPSIPTDTTSISNTLAPNKNGSTAVLTSNATIYIGNSNGTLYALDGLGVMPDAETRNASRNVGVISQQFFFNAIDTAQTKWWLSLNGIYANDSSATNFLSITSAPAIYKDPAASPDDYTIYVTSGNDGTNMGRLYAVNSSGPLVGTTPGMPGSANYTRDAQAKYQFPAKNRPALGSMTGSPVVFTNPNDSTTRVYFAANSGMEGTNARPTSDVSGRIWSVALDLSSSPSKPWAYPRANDPNDTTLDNVAEPSAPIGSFFNSTPAIGIVQFPATITYGPGGGSKYTHKDNAATGGSSLRMSQDVTNTAAGGQSVPMLYIGSATEAPDSQGSNFYALDLDGNDDNSRNAFYFNGGPANRTGETIGAGGFESSPALVVNSTRATIKPDDGNGGAVFIAGGDNRLYEIGATYTSDSSPTGSTGDAISTRPQLLTFQYGGFGPLSSPCVAAYDSSDLQVSTATGSFVTDWVYGGDGFTGFARGITPADRTGTGGTIDYGTGGPGVDYGGSGFIPQNVPLHTYLFDGTTGHPGTSVDMNDANRIGEALPVFEWGGKVYIRISNVVPPNPSNSSDLWMSDGSTDLSDLKTGDYYYSNGSAINIQLSEVGRDGQPLPSSGADIAQIPAVILPPTTPTALTPVPSTADIPEGFTREKPSGGGTQDTTSDQLQDYVPSDSSKSMWIGAATYMIGDGTQRKNTPGARRRIITATQTAQIYQVQADGSHKFTGTVTLTIDTSSTATTVRNRRGTRTRLSSQTQPTFGVLNPIAVRGGGPPIPLGTTSPAAKTIGGAADGLLGPFHSVPFNGNTTLQLEDLGALSNGNRIYALPGDVPKNGILTGDAGAKTDVSVVTATSDIVHGSTGDNGDPTTAVMPSTSGKATDSAAYRSQSFGQYALNVADRSILGLSPLANLKNLSIENAAAQWNDNTSPNKSGPAARVNPFPAPLDDIPTGYGVGPNSSQDYPDISARAIRQTLYKRHLPLTGPMTSNALGEALPMTETAVSLDPATETSNPIDPSNRTINTDIIQVQIRVPKYQPANLQIFSNSLGQTTPDKLGLSSTISNLDAFPMGYVAQKKIYIDSNRNRRWDAGEAYRVISVYTGVPVDMTMNIVNQTTDLGKLPQSFGVETSRYAGLDNLYASTYGYGFMPYNPAYQAYFKPVTVLNQGNVNLLNVHFNQQQIQTNVTGGSTTYTNDPLTLLSDALDPLAGIYGYDLNGITGPRSNLPGSTTGSPLAAAPFLIRTSLDTDLIRAYGRVSTLSSTVYPGATFHKARVGDGSPALLTVPDVPRNVAANITPSPPTLDTTTYQPQSVTLPYVGLAVPLGTPVGNYAQGLRVFEGIDDGVTSNDGGTTAPVPYPDLYSSGASGGGALYKPLLPPMYGNTVVDGTTALAATPATQFSRVITTGGLVDAQPLSTPTVLKASVIETRITDNATYGNLPQVDKIGSKLNTAGNPTGAATADFLPSAFRNAFWNGRTLSGNGSISLYWTSARGNSDPTGTTPTSPYNIIGTNLPFTVAGATGSQQGYFDAADPTGHWFQPATTNANGLMFSNLLSDGTNTEFVAAPDQQLFNGANFTSNGTAYAFTLNVKNSGAAYQNAISCYALNTANGQLSGQAIPVTTDAAQGRFGVRGLKFVAPTNFTDLLDTSASPARVTNNLWAFWNGGSRGRSAMFYSSTVAGQGFEPYQALPLPAGLSSAANASAILVQAPDASGLPVPMIEVTYSGVGADGNADIYVSRYRPYFLRKGDGTILTVKNTLGATVNAVALALTGGAALTEQMQPDTAHQYYQARDVAWIRPSNINPGSIDILVNGTSLLTVTTGTTTTPITPTYDRASGQLVYLRPATVVGNPTLSMSNGAQTGNLTITAVYVDPARGRVRFRTRYQGTSPSTQVAYDVPLDTAQVTAIFQSQARRITTDSRADTEPVAFLDEAYKKNESPGLNRVPADRYWFIWRKSGAPGTATTPTLYSKTQRLTIFLHDNNTPAQPVVLYLDNTYKPTGLSLTDMSATNAIPSADLLANVDVDWVRGRLYFPVSIDGISTEGHPITVSFTYRVGTGTTTYTMPAPSTIQWMDELRYNDSVNQPTNSTLGAASTTEHALPIDVATNESNVSAFLDPFAYADVAGGVYDPINGGLTHTDGSTTVTNTDQPHKVWLFWNSTRNGTADLYYETIDPRFSANP